MFSGTSPLITIMRDLMDGARAGLFGALTLTLWSLLHALGPLNDASEASGVLYVATSFGLLGLPQLLYGAGLGLVLGVWRAALRRAWGQDWPQTLAKPEQDRWTASALLSAPLLGAIVAAAVALTHLYVTARFARPTFQAAGLGLVALAAALGTLAASPLVLRAAHALVSALPLARPGQTKPRATLAVAGLMAAAVALVGFAGYRYASGLHIWPATTLRQGLALALLTPALMVALRPVNAKLDRLAWRVGLPVAGVLVTVLCFQGAWGWSSANADMRKAITRDSALVSAMANQLQRFADRDGDGYAQGMGGFDCDDADPNINPGAVDLPGNGVDEDCDGQDTPLPSGDKHASRKIVNLALNTAQLAAHTASVKEDERLPPAPKNVLIILVDTLRQDHLGYAGYERQTSPNIDALAAQSSVFMDAYATAPHTPRSIPSLFLSRYASKVKWSGAQFNYPKVLPENLSVFEVLQEKGWSSHGFSSHFYFDPKRGLDQGFASWDNEGALDIAGSNDDIAAPRIWAKLEPFLKARGQDKARPDAAPFGLFVHLFEPHSRWIGHKEHSFSEAKDGHERHINNYDSEIAFVDVYVGKIIQGLKDAGLYEDTIIILTSDHGEAFKDHGMYFHGQNLYNEVIRVPLIVRVPGWPARRIQGPVSLVDIAPTLLAMQQITIPADFQGQSLLPAMLGQGPVPDRPVFAELLPYTNWKEHHKAIIYKQHKLIHVLTAGTVELYDLAQDPKEQRNLSAQDRPKAQELQGMLKEWSAP